MLKLWHGINVSYRFFQIFLLHLSPFPFCRNFNYIRSKIHTRGFVDRNHMQRVEASIIFCSVIEICLTFRITTVQEDEKI